MSSFRAIVWLVFPVVSMYLISQYLQLLLVSRRSSYQRDSMRSSLYLCLVYLTMSYLTIMFSYDLIPFRSQRSHSSCLMKFFTDNSFRSSLNRICHYWYHSFKYIQLMSLGYPEIIAVLLVGATFFLSFTLFVMLTPAYLKFTICSMLWLFTTSLHLLGSYWM